jgi:methyl-accepting chemotaxis protein
MKSALRRLIGISLIVAGVVGLLLSVAALVALARVERRIEAGVARQLDVLERAAQASTNGLNIADATLLQTVDTIYSLQTTVTAIGATVEGSRPTLDAVAALLGDQLPAAVESTQRTLTSASESAKAVDDFLAVLSRVPFMSSQSYDPDQQLHVGLEEVSASLNGLPASLRETRKSLVVAASGLQDLQAGLAGTAANVGQIADSLNGARDTLSQYRGIVADLDSSLVSARTSLPQALRWLRLGFSFVLIWLGIVQFALITQGGELLARGRQVRLQSEAKKE